ncbi:MAG: DUF6786 family protein [Phycisphaeraceae bacterium]
MPTWLSNLQQSFKSHNFDHRVWDAGAGKLLVTVDGARIIGCAMPSVEGNLFWHPPELERGELDSVAGGDRLWVAPEAGFIFTDIKKARRDPVNHAKVPDCMDPGDWRIVEDGPGHLRLTTEMAMTDHRTGKKVNLRIARQFDVIDRPPAPLPKRIKCLSFTIRNELTMLDCDHGTIANVWDLLQLPATGWLICPTLGRVDKPHSYYESFGPKHVKSDSSAVRFLIDGKRRIKMGLTPMQTTGRMGYYRVPDAWPRTDQRRRGAGKHSTLIFRMFMPIPGQPYADVPLKSDAMIGEDCLQSYNDDGTYASGSGFGEMEHHDPALVAGQEPTSRVGVSVTHVLAGHDADIRAAGKMLLGVRV